MEDDYNKKDILYYNHTRHELVKFIPKNIKKVLDVGCASGNFGAMLKDLFRCEVWGIEPHKNSAEIAQHQLDHVINDVFDKNTLDLSNQKFDCIFFNDVLEHLAQPENALDLALTLLAEEGHVVASIPNIRFYPAMLSLIRYKDFKYLEAGVMDKTHLRFFTRKSMIRLFEENGFFVETVEGINRHYFKYFELLNLMTFNWLSDMRYPQYVIVAKKK